MIEVVVTHQATEWLSAEHSVLTFVDILEDQALVPRDAPKTFESSPEVRLRDVEDADLQHLVGFGVRHQVLEPPPGPLQLLKVPVVHDYVDLLAKLPIKRSDDPLDACPGIGGYQRGGL